MAGHQEGSSNNKWEASIPKFPYKLPDTLLEMFPKSENLFKPRVVSLGRFYHKEENNQQDTEDDEHKSKEKNNLRVTEDDKGKIKDLVLVLAGRAKEDFDSKMEAALVNARHLYEGEKLDDDFDETMILDACFIIHAIDYITEGKSEVLDKKPHLLPLILEDMFLLENQVPIIVVKAAMKVLGRDSGDIHEFVKKIARHPKDAPKFLFKLRMGLPWPIQFLVFLLLILITPAILLVLLPLALLILLVVCLPLGLVWLMCCLPFRKNQGDLEQQNKDRIENKESELTSGQEQQQKKKNDSNDKEESNQEQTSGQEPYHDLLGLLAHLIGCSEENQHDNTWLPPRRATELTDAGIKFHRSPTDKDQAWSVKDVDFKQGLIHGHLFLPSLAQLTKARLVNLMVYEVCQRVGGHGITSYVSFLDGLIDCPEDVKELRSKQILPKALGDDQGVTDFFNTVGTFLAPSAYHKVLDDIDSHCQSRWRPSAAKFWDKHFSSPWTAVSFLIAMLLYVNTVATASKNYFGIKK